MNDYLHNLVARTLQRSPVVRPRLPSLFESFAAGQAVNASSPSETIHEDGTSTGPAAEVFGPRVSPPAHESDPTKSETGSRATMANTVEGDNRKTFVASRRAISQPGELTRSSPQIVALVSSQTMEPEAPS